jgi:S-adenosylmethionine-dependent methyltransferase
MNISSEAVRNYYATFDENEWNRLTGPEGTIEFAVTTHTLNKYLPHDGRILDIGGGPGRYSIWLAQRGYRIVLADISPNLLDIARAKIAEASVQSQIEEMVTCDACDLSRFGDNSFDGVLCLGPFYHLIEPADRERAVSELVRVLKPNGIAFVAFMPIYTFLRRTLALKDERQHLAQPAFVSRLLNEGVFLNDISGRFNAGYGVRPNAVAPFMEQHGLRTMELLADTGFVAAHAEQLAELRESDPMAYETVMEIIMNTAGDSSLLGASIHLLYVGRKHA